MYMYVYIYIYIYLFIVLVLVLYYASINIRAGCLGCYCLYLVSCITINITYTAVHVYCITY